MPAERAPLESSEGRVDGEIQRVLDVGREYPTLPVLRPSFNYIGTLRGRGSFIM
jgi:polar amino acid transport system substrate-binding protein